MVPPASVSDERKFIGEIDSRFPYDNFDRGRDLIDRGISISPHAAFRVLYELCLPAPRTREKLSEAQLKRFLYYWRSKCKHPAAAMMSEVAESLIAGRELSVEAAIDRMNDLEKYCGLYSALSILYMSCDDKFGLLEPIYAAINARWAAAPDTNSSSAQ